MTESSKNQYSVIVPLFNKEPHIASTLTSILNQTYTHFEVLVVNDASTDKSRDIVAGFSDSRISILDRDTQGPGGYAARNYGIERAQHNLLAFLDADDTWHPTFLEKMNSMIIDYPKAGFYTSGWIEKSDLKGEVTNSYTRINSKKKIHSLDLREFLNSYSEYTGPVCSSVAVVDKELIKKAGKFPVCKCRFGGDIDTWFRIMLEGNNLMVQPVPLATYNKEAVNMVTRANALSIIETCVKKTAEELYASLDSDLTLLIKKFVNHFQYLQVQKKARAFSLRPSDLRYVYKKIAPVTFTVFFLFSLLPFPLQKAIVKSYRTLKLITNAILKGLSMVCSHLMIYVH